MHIHKVIHHSNHICKQNRLDTAIISLNNHINKQIHKQKTLKWKQHLDKFNYEHNLHSMWGTIAKPFNKNPPTKQNRRIPFETKTTMAGIDKIKVLNKQFMNVTPYSTNKINRHIYHSMKALPTEKIRLTTTQMQLVISKSTNNNSNGPDGINIRHFKLLRDLPSDSSQTCTTLPSTLRQYPIFLNAQQSSPLQNQTKTATLAQTTNPYHTYHSFPKH